MKVTALEEYGLRCMLLFTRSGSSKPLTIPEISSREGLSLPYTGKLLNILKQSGLIKSVRGRNGGYLLTRSPKEIMLGEVFAVLGQPLYGKHHCERYSGDHEACVHNRDCTVKTMWAAFDNFISGALNNMSLADLALGNYEVFKSLNNTTM
jgi:Rrf2 family protein